MYYLYAFVLIAVIVSFLADRGKTYKAIKVAYRKFIKILPAFASMLAFPLCGILLSKGVTYTVLSAFTTTLMMVGFVTFPIEKKYFGVRVGIIRNVASLLIAIIVAIMTGIFYGEIFAWG